MPKFTFHVPVNDYDSFEIEADTLEEAESVLDSMMPYGPDDDQAHKYDIVYNIGADPRYNKGDAYDCVVIDENDEQLR